MYISQQRLLALQLRIWCIQCQLLRCLCWIYTYWFPQPPAKCRIKVDSSSKWVTSVGAGNGPAEGGGGAAGGVAQASCSASSRRKLTYLSYCVTFLWVRHEHLPQWPLLFGLVWVPSWKFPTKPTVVTLRGFQSGLNITCREDAIWSTCIHFQSTAH